MAGLVALVCPRTGSRSTLFALRTDCWRSTGTSLRTRPRGKSQPAAFQCSARRFPPDDSVPKGQANERRQDPVARIPRRRHARPKRRPPARRRQGPARSGESDLLGLPRLTKLRPRPASGVSRERRHRLGLGNPEWQVAPGCTREFRVAASKNRRFQPKRKEDRTMSTHTAITAPTQFVEANGIRFAYRRWGKRSGLPLVFNHHLNGNLDNWDPAVLDGLAKEREVIIFNNAGVASSTGEVPATFAGMARNAEAFVDA